MRKITFIIILSSIIFSGKLSAHCDSYDGPVIKDALHALEINNVNLVLKWISPEQEKEIINLFNTVVNLKSQNKEIYSLSEKYFLETLVRLHRETEGAPYTGLKEAGHVKPIVKMSDNALEDSDPDRLIAALTNHISIVVQKKYEKAEQLKLVKEESASSGRQYVDAYVDYVHTIEALHDLVDGVHNH